MEKKQFKGRSNINLYNTDCILFMRDIPYNCYDLAIPDPVYGIDGNNHRNNVSRGKLVKSTDYHNALWNQKKTSGIYFNELKRVSKHQAIFGANYFPEVSKFEFKTPRREQYTEFIKDNPTNWIIWDKVNSKTGFNDCELIHVSFPIETRIFYFMWSGMMQGLSYLQGTIQQANKSKNQNRIHPTEKPFEVYKYLYTEIQKEIQIQKILDTHGGSFSNANICWDMNLDLDACEIDRKYFADGAKRVDWHCRQQQLY